jgi:O-antigen ligase
MTRIQNLLFFLYCFSLNFDSWSIFRDQAFSIPKLIAAAYCLSTFAASGFRFTFGPYKAAILAICSTFAVIVLAGLAHWNSKYPNVIPQSFLLNLVVFAMMLQHAGKTPSILRKGLLFYTAGVILLCCASLLNIGVEVSAEGRKQLFGENENVVGSRGSEAFIILVALFTEGKHLAIPLRLALAALAIPPLGLMFATGSRLAFLSAVLGMGIIFLSINKKHFGIKVVCLLAFLLSAPLVLEYVRSQDVLFRRLERTLERGDLGSREVLWMKLAPYVLEQPLIGYGLPGYRLVSARCFGYQTNVSPHNVFLEVALLGGFVGLFLYLFFWRSVFLNALRCFRSQGYVLPLALLTPAAGWLLSAQALDVKNLYLIAAFALASPFDPSYVSNRTNMIQVRPIRKFLVPRLPSKINTSSQA